MKEQMKKQTISQMTIAPKTQTKTTTPQVPLQGFSQLGGRERRILRKSMKQLENMTNNQKMANLVMFRPLKNRI